MNAIQTWYEGHRYRSRLEARWAVVFKRLEITSLYEHEGFVVAGRPYLPDFYLTQSRTWVEVKGTEDELDHALMRQAPLYLPGGSPRLLILGPIPEPPATGTWAWVGLEAVTDPAGDAETYADSWRLMHGGIARATETSAASPASWGDEGWLEPCLDMAAAEGSVAAAYRAGRSSRFEHGGKG